MAIPLILSVFSTFATGGPQVRFAAIANHFGRRYRHAIIAMDGDLACRERLNSELDVVFPAIGFVKGQTVANLWRIRSFLRTVQPDVLVTANWGSIEWAIANLVPLVRHVHMEDGFGPDELIHQVPRRVWTRRLVLRRSIVVLPSVTLHQIAIKHWRLPQNQLRLIPNGVDVTRFAAAKRTQKATPIIGTVAALRPEKNLSRLLRAFADLNAAAHLVIVGDGPEYFALQELAENLGIANRVRFAGHVAMPAGEYADFDLFALSSNTEQMPLSVLEAMASGLPVVATNVGDVPTMLSDANLPFVVEMKNKSFTDALDMLLSNSAEAHRVGAANRLKVEREYNEAIMFQKYATLLDGDA